MQGVSQHIAENAGHVPHIDIFPLVFQVATTAIILALYCARTTSVFVYELPSKLR